MPAVSGEGGLTWRLSCWRDEVQKCKCKRRTWLLTTDYRNAARCKSYSDCRQCWRNTSVHGHVACLVAERAVRWMTWPARVYVGVVVCMILRVLYICCIVVVYALWCSRRLNLTAEIALASPHPPRCYAPRSHMHTGASVHATQPAPWLNRRD